LKVQPLCELDPLKRLETIDTLMSQSGDDSDVKGS